MELYEGVNINNTLMRNAYQRAMLFLTYIQGPLVNERGQGSQCMVAKPDYCQALGYE
jgi:hypothetical protein